MSYNIRVASLVILLNLTGANLTSAQVTFNQTAINSGDTGSPSIVAGDFNGDGILDMVTINTSSISFYKGLGGGKYAAAVKRSIPVQNLGQVAAADFNRDGNLDLAIAGGPSGTTTPHITILLGNGDGTFKAGTNIATNGNAGECPNPGGKPKHDVASAFARAVIEGRLDAAFIGFTRQLAKGNAYAFTQLAERGYGKLVQKQELTGKDGGPLEITEISDADLNKRIADLERDLGLVGAIDEAGETGIAQAREAKNG